MKTTEYKFDRRPIGYEILDNGYDIYLGQRVWITQRVDGYIPYRDIDPDADLETCCLEHIKEIVGANEEAQKQNNDAVEDAEVTEVTE